MLLLTSLMLGAGLLASPAGAQSQEGIDDPPPAKDATSLSNLTPEEQALFDSGLPLISNVDPSTGAVLDVKVDDRVRPMGVVTNNCSAGRACWYG